MIDSNDSLTTSDPESEDTNLAAESLDYENAFRRLDVGVYKDAVDVEEVLQILKARQDLKRELDEKHQEYLFETDKLRQSLVRVSPFKTAKNPFLSQESLRNTEREQCSLLRRNMDQILGLPEDVQSTVERRLATVIDRYVFVDQTVRPIKVLSFTSPDASQYLWS